MDKTNFSVLLSVYYKENPSYFDDSMRSIITDQTLPPDEVVLVKDGKLTKDLDKIVEKWQEILDSKLKVVELPENLGLAEALNIGLKECSFELVARMDTDDISLPLRFEKQISFFKDNNYISCVSALVEEYDEVMEKPLNIRELPENHSEIYKFCQRRNPISHPVAMFKKKDVLSVGGYPNVYPEDYFLWLKMIQAGYKLANIQEILLKMRTGNSFIGRRGYQFLKGELAIYNFMYKTKFISFYVFFTNICIRSFIRLSPTRIKILFYKYFR